MGMRLCTRKSQSFESFSSSRKDSFAQCTLSKNGFSLLQRIEAKFSFSKWNDFSAFFPMCNGRNISSWMVQQRERRWRPRKRQFPRERGEKKKIQRGCSGVKNSTWEFPTTIASPALLRVEQSGTSQGEEWERQLFLMMMMVVVVIFGWLISSLCANVAALFLPLRWTWGVWV